MAQAAEAAPAAAAPEPHEQGGGVRSLLFKFLRMWVVYMLIKTVLVGTGVMPDTSKSAGEQGSRADQPAEPNAPAQRQSGPVVTNLWAPETEFGLQLWLSSGRHNELLWDLGGLSYSEAQPEEVHEVADIPAAFRERLLQNQTVYARLMLSTASDADGARSTVVRTWPLSQHRRPPKKRSNRQNLLSGSSEAPAESEPSKLALAGGGAEVAEEPQFEDSRVIYWKPELSVRLATDWEVYRPGTLPPDLYAFYQVSGAHYEPPVVFDEFWLMRERLIQVNQTLRTEGIPLPLRLSYSPLSLWKWRLQFVLERGMRNQAKISSGDLGDALSSSVKPQMARLKDTGIDARYLPVVTEEGDELVDKQTDIMRAMWLDNNPYFLVLTFCVSLLHSVFDFLAFKNDISFWKNSKSAKGLSVRSIAINLVCGVVILFYLMDNDTSWMIMVSSAVGVVIEAWKLLKCIRVEPADKRGERLAALSERQQSHPGPAEAKAAGKKAKQDQNAAAPKPEAAPANSSEESSEEAEEDTVGDEGLVVLGYRFAPRPGYTDPETNEYDREAIRYLSWAMYPLLVGYTIYSLVYNEHKGWYSFILETLVGAVYSFGFVLMCPQLWVNYRLKSVAHLPWRMLSYKFLNTIIDDLFAFVIRMPLLHRLSCFRDDLVFLVFLYQKWIYRTDYTRTNEYGYNPAEAEAHQATHHAPESANPEIRPIADSPAEGSTPQSPLEEEPDANDEQDQPQNELRRRRIANKP